MEDARVVEEIVRAALSGAWTTTTRQEILEVLSVTGAIRL
jgi:hypothetical protein